MTYHTPSPGLGLLPPVFAAGAVLLLGFAVARFANVHDEGNLLKGQSNEQAANPAVFAITEPDAQPAGTDVASWSTDGYGGPHHFLVRLGSDGTASLSDPLEPTAAGGRGSGPIVSCASLNLEVYDSHPFPSGGKSYRVQLTAAGNSAVCLDG